MRTVSSGYSLRTGAFCLGVALCAVLFAAPAANADYISGFEDLIASPFGEILTGQDGYYIPPGTTSVDFLAYTYDGNVLELPANPTGEDQFIGGTGPAGNAYARAQRDMSFAAGPIWIIGYDFAAVYLGSPPSANNIGSFSLRNEPAAVTHKIHLMSWVDPENPTLFNAFYMAYDAGGTMFAQPGASPGAGWENLELNHWYRAWTKVDLDTNMIVEVGIIDLETMEEWTFEPTDWYLAGGAAGTPALPECFRFFAGGGVAGNSLAFDNIDIHEEPLTPVESMSWGAIKSIFK
ncbi:MAG: hypothetical protein KAY24_19330 [Candidatus Eisenbacteria sp.]|nr:hypothetical protein [Candidatus Eisenbacteria bacterium]